MPKLDVTLMPDLCNQCGRPLKPRAKQPVLPEMDLLKPRACGTCGSLIYVRKLLRGIPTPYDDTWKTLTIWQRNFLYSIRERVIAGQLISKKQIEALKEIRARFAGE
jgi:hypothetical protein